MTIGTTTSVITYQGDGSTTVFTFPYVGDSTSDITVKYTDNSGNVSTISPSLYTLVINAPSPGQLWGVGGSVTYPLSGPAIAANTYITILRSIPFVQNTSISNQGAFYPEVVEIALDTLLLQLQQTQTQLSFAIKCPQVDLNTPTTLPPAAERANTYLKFDYSGNPIVSPT